MGQQMPQPPLIRITAWKPPVSGDFLQKYADALAEATCADGLTIVPAESPDDTPRWRLMQNATPLSAPYTISEMIVAVSAYRAGWRAQHQA